MLVCDALETRSSWFVCAFGIACFGASASGWLAGAGPFGLIEGTWAYLPCAGGGVLGPSPTLLGERVASKLGSGGKTNTQLDFVRFSSVTHRMGQLRERRTRQ